LAAPGIRSRLIHSPALPTPYDLRASIDKMKAAPDSGWTFTLALDWAVLSAFSDDLDGRIVAQTRAAGASLWSEDAGEARRYHFEGTGRQLAAIASRIHSDVNQRTSAVFTVSGSNSFVSSVQAQLASRARREGITITPTLYPGRFRTHLVVELQGTVGAVHPLVQDFNETLGRFLGRAYTPRRAPGNAAIPQPAAAPARQRRARAAAGREVA
jgi:hypothetical protein